MEVKINKEIRNYTEAMFFGLSLRQFLFSILACIVAITVFFLLRSYFSLETVSWVCILVAFPFAAIGFIRYNGMPAEKFLAAYIKSEILTPKRLLFRNTNMYWQIMQQAERERKKGRRNSGNDKNTEDNHKTGKRKVFHTKGRAGYYSGQADL